MNELVTIPAYRLQVLDLMRSTMRPVLAVMNLEPPARPAPRAAPAMLLHRLAAVDEKHTLCTSARSAMKSALPTAFTTKLVAFKSPHRT